MFFNEIAAISKVNASFNRDNAFLDLLKSIFWIQIALCKIPDNFDIFLCMIRQVASLPEGCNKIYSCIRGAYRKKSRFFLERNMF